MLNNYLKITFRNIRRNKGYTFINITGLAIGMACCIMMLLWVQDELNFDRFHEEADDIYRVTAKQGDSFGFTATPARLGPALKKDFPDISNSTRIKSTWRVLLKTDDKAVYESRFYFADPEIFEIFSFPFVIGDPATALSDPGSIVLTESKAKQIFGDEDPVGKIIRYGESLVFTVSGVMKDIPNNSSIKFDFIAPFSAYEKLDNRLDDWGRFDFQTYVFLGENADQQQTEVNIKDYLSKYKRTSYKLKLQPLTGIHLYDTEGGMGDIIYVYIFTSIAVFVLVIGCINFINLTTARAGRKAKEVGLRKVVGARRKDLVKQLLGESVIFALIALVFAIIIAGLVMPAFNTISGKELSLNFADNFQALTGLIIIALVTGIFSGVYPAFFLSSFQPVKVLKSISESGMNRGAVLRKSLVLLQYSISIILIVSTLIVYDQLDYIRNSKLGFNKEHLVYIPMNTNTFNQYYAVKDELQKNADVIGVTATEALPTYMANWSNIYRWDGKETEGPVRMNSCSIDRNFIEFFDMKIIEGTDLSEDNSTESRVFIVNEEAVRQMGMTDPIGKRMNLWGKYNSRIIGVVEDFHFRPLTQEIEPIILHFSPGEHNRPTSFSYICVRINSMNMMETMDYLEETVKTFAPEYPFEYGFLDERIDNMYRAERRMGTVFGNFAVLAILISCLGLFGLVSFMAEQRKKEIGIRKVLGAAVSTIVLLISREFVLLAAAANVIAWPVAYFVMDRWLQSFAYRVNIEWMVFLLSAALAILITLLTIAFQSIKAAVANPVKSLRYE
ncbi:MAG: FtsX-like permease family protein [bacterium]|nr:FtsX-like permease family protein [bacterium]